MPQCTKITLLPISPSQTFLNDMEHAQTPELQYKFKQVKDLFTDPNGGCSTYPMALGEPGAGECELIRKDTHIKKCFF